jgi:hypothetical protein
MSSEWLLRFRELNSDSVFRQLCADSANSADRSTSPSILTGGSAEGRPNGTKDTIGAQRLKNVTGGAGANPEVEDAGAASFVAELRVRGVRLEVAGNGIVASAPRGVMSPQERRRLREDGALMAVLRAEAPPAIDRVIHDRQWWSDLYEERSAIREFDGGYSRAEAESHAWGELQNRRHLEHGERVPPDICAGCRRPIGSAAALDLIDGGRVHHQGNNCCLNRHGERWRAAATRALIALGLRPPAGLEE